MAERDDTIGPAIFGAAVRTIGFMLLLYGLYWCFYGFVAALRGNDNEYPLYEYAIAILIYSITGVAMVRLAPGIVSWAYPTRDEENTGDTAID